MNKYSVTIPFIVYVTAEVTAASNIEAIEKAINDVDLSNYSGNGGCDRLVGSYDDSHTIEPGGFIDHEDYQPVAVLLED